MPDTVTTKDLNYMSSTFYVEVCTRIALAPKYPMITYMGARPSIFGNTELDIQLYEELKESNMEDTEMDLP